MPKILLIDDDNEVREELRSVLKRSRFQVLEAADGERGLELCRAERPDLMIVEILLPKMLGTEIVRVLKREYPAMKIIAVATGSRVGVDTYLRMARVLGADGVFEKPLDAQEVAKTIRVLLSR